MSGFYPQLTVSQIHPVFTCPAIKDDSQSEVIQTSWLFDYWSVTFNCRWLLISVFLFCVTHSAILLIWKSDAAFSCVQSTLQSIKYDLEWMGSKRESQVKRKSQQNVLFKTDLKMPEGPKLTELTCKRLLQFTTVSSLLLPFFWNMNLIDGKFLHCTIKPTKDNRSLVNFFFSFQMW